MKSERRSVVFELTVENIPARFIVGAKEQLSRYVSEMLKAKNLDFTQITTYATYRRLIVFISDVPAKTEKIVEKVYGPKASLLKDPTGAFTQAAIGFARSVGVKPEELTIEKHEKKGEVICALKTKPSVRAVEVLAEVFLESVKRLEFPKNMIWEETRFKFARPIRNILALWGDKVIPMEICGVRSGKTTYSSYFTYFKKITIKNAESYFSTLEKNNIIADDTKRKNIILSILDGVSKTLKAEIDKDDRVVEENIYLCEYPRSVVVKYPSDFTKLPQPLLNLVMKKQLKFFPVRDKSGFMPIFVGIRDGISKGQSNVENGYLNVFKARCADALFFYETDLKTDISLWRERLNNMIFQSELGTLYDKTQRVKKISSWLSNAIGVKDVSDLAEYIYYDLASNVVGEFTELENTMNYYYAEKYHIFDEDLKKAISEINLPYSNTSPLPSNTYSCINAISHKIDTLVGDFLIDVIPTGGNDPHGLRRAGIGIFRIIAEKNLDIPLVDLILYTLSLYPDGIRRRKDEKTLITSLLNFIYQRAFSYFEEKGVSGDVLNSVESLFIREGNILRFCRRIEALKTFRSREDFRKFILIYKRLRNITKDHNDVFVDTSLFEFDEERKVYEMAQTLNDEIKNLVSSSQFLTAIDKLLALNDILEEFFNKVLVMVDDEKIRNNRLGLLKRVHLLFNDIAEIEKIVSG